MASGGQFARIVQPRRLMLVALAANAPCNGVLFTAGLPLVLMAALTAMRLSAGDSGAAGSDLTRARIGFVRRRPGDP
jgi:hypothetical protein